MYSKFEVEMSPKLVALLGGAPTRKKSKAPIPILVPIFVVVLTPTLAVAATSSHSSPCPKKDKGKTPTMGTSYKRRHGVGASSTGTLSSTPAEALELWAPIFSVEELGKQVTAIDIAREHDTCMALA